MVYGVFSGFYSDWEVHGYFEKKADAEAYCNKMKNKNRSAYYVKPMLNMADGDPDVYRLYGYNEYWDTVYDEEGEFSTNKKRTRVVNYRTGVRCVEVWLKPCDYNRDKVRKIALDALAKYDAEKEGIT